MQHYAAHVPQTLTSPYMPQVCRPQATFRRGNCTSWHCSSIKRALRVLRALLLLYDPRETFLVLVTISPIKNHFHQHRA